MFSRIGRRGGDRLHWPGEVAHLMTFRDDRRSPQDAPGFRLAWPDDWRALLRTRANLLITGQQEARDAFMRAATPLLREPIRAVACSGPLFLDAASTLILTDLDGLDDTGQRSLLQWVGEPRNADTQIVSLTSVRLLAPIGPNRFDPELYYRLNTIHLDVQTA